MLEAEDELLTRLLGQYEPLNSRRPVDGRGCFRYVQIHMVVAYSSYVRSLSEARAFFEICGGRDRFWKKYRSSGSMSASSVVDLLFFEPLGSATPLLGWCFGREGMGEGRGNLKAIMTGGMDLKSVGQERKGSGGEA